MLHLMVVLVMVPAGQPGQGLSACDGAGPWLNRECPGVGVPLDGAGGNTLWLCAKNAGSLNAHGHLTTELGRPIDVLLQIKPARTEEFQRETALSELEKVRGLRSSMPQLEIVFVLLLFGPREGMSQVNIRAIRLAKELMRRKPGPRVRIVTQKDAALLWTRDGMPQASVWRIRAAGPAGSAGAAPWTRRPSMRRVTMRDLGHTRGSQLVHS
jgi:hypothetical protein